MIAWARLGRSHCNISRMCVLSVVGVVCVAANTRAQAPVPAGPPAMEITADAVLDPAKTYGPIVIKSSNITIYFADNDITHGGDDREVRLMGHSALALRVAPASEHAIRLLYPRTRDAAIPLAGKTSLDFWVKMLNNNIHAWKGLSRRNILPSTGRRCADRMIENTDWAPCIS